MEVAASARAVARTEDAPSARTQVDDRAAVADLYERHFDGIFDFALRMVRNRDVAESVVRKTFSKATATATELYLTARDRALEELRYQRRFDGRSQDREGFDFTQVDADRLEDPSAVLFDRALIEIVWDCAAALPPSDYAAIDLHVRRGLDSEELGESESRLARLCAALEDTTKAMLLATRAGHTCADLDATATLPAIRQHAAACPVCQETKRCFVSSLEVFRSLAPVRPANGFRENLWRQLQPRGNGRLMRRLRR